jgi:flagellar biosynthesis protein FlhF
MQVKVFEATDMTSGLKQVKDAFGPDALILSTRTIRRGGKLGIMAKPLLEITAAIDNDWPEKDAQPNSSYPKHDKIRQHKEPSPPEDDLTYENLWDTPRQDPAPAAVEAAPASSELKDEIENLKNTIAGLTQRVSTIQAATVHQKPYIEPEFTNNTQPDNDFLYKRLTCCGINHTTAITVAEQAKEILRTSVTGEPIDPESALKAAMTKMFNTEKLLQQKLNRQLRISLVGPTGVGKTTTIAKMAANYLNKFGGKIALITIDTYRIAAVEQLKVYGEIMRLPVEVIIKPQEVGQALRKYQDYDLILIDTAGRSPKNTHDLAEMASFLDPRHAIENHLLLSAGTRDRELAETIEKFSILPLKTFIFSKIDECDQLGVIANIHSQNSTPLSFLTNGQRVPEDIITPNPATIANFIVNDHRTLHNG